MRRAAPDSRSATGISRTRSSRSATPTSSSPPVAVIAASCASGSTSPRPEPEQGQRRPGPTSDRHRAGRHAPAERRRERDRREPVERRLEEELVGAVAQAVVERAEDGQRAGAEDQRRDHEALDEAVPLRRARCRRSVGSAASRRATRPGTPGAAASRRSRRAAARRARSASARCRRRRRDRSSSSTAIADVPAISSVTRPSESVTTSRVRTGSRLPRSTPMALPSSTVATFTTVPRPGITGLL